MIDFSTKFSHARVFTKKKQISLSGLLMEYESDRGRIINSAAVRRLQQKTQVFPLERNAAVRSRLTHSLEVQQVGRFLVQTIFRSLTELQQTELGLTGLDRHMETVVEMACLMHDIGNPPFGHFGEQAINDWFEQNLQSCLPVYQNETLPLSDEIKSDICHFEGNAQGIRLVQSLQQLNLTYTQVAGILKYTRCGGEAKPAKGQPFDYLKKKVGFYLSEKNYVDELNKQLGLQHGHRHPVSYIMEAADDISYCIADLEDAVEKGILDIDKLSRVLIEEFNLLIKEFGVEPAQLNIDIDAITQKALASASRADIAKSSQYFISLRVGVTHPLVKHAAKRFIDNVDAVYHGSFNQALLEDNSAEHALSESLKNVAIKYAFCDKEVESRELQGYRILSGLLECYKPLLCLTREQFAAVIGQQKSAPLLAKRLYKKLSSKHVRAYLAVVHEGTSNQMEFYYRCRLLQDYISGMTDQFAFDEYRALMVID
ncbi:dGTPase [Neptunicella marina]|uniref:Probable deoxyguanosinetriphosphate triphosphohydrolase n=1 Tax=Neptunicella marina TaxID=2125989 RepID=A0A8J6M3R9_9ALTE|nr:dGTPase [Neptunicella marina]MBC3765591.1 dGTPase [Neptunicella marina]